MEIWRLIDEGVTEPERTFAIDETLLKTVSTGMRNPTLHFYVRKMPTISLGYMQSVEKDVNKNYCIKNNIKIIRRSSSGGSIYTDSGQLIFGIVFKDKHRKIEDSYAEICGTLADTISTKLRIPAKHTGINDITVDGKKISGSAQRRYGSFTLHHGTLIESIDKDMAFNALTPDRKKYIEKGLVDPSERVASLYEITGHHVSMKKLKNIVMETFETVFDVKFQSERLLSYEENMVTELIKMKYANDEWNFKR